MDTRTHRAEILFLRRPALAGVIALATGMVLGPLGLQLLRPQLLDDGAPIESLSEIALLICLFCIGLRLRVPLEWRLWRVPLRLSTLTMLATTAIAAAAAHLIFDLSLSQALLLGAIVSPTDPVLASETATPTDGEQESPSFVPIAESAINNGLATALVVSVLALMGFADGEVGAPGAVSLMALWLTAGGVALGWLVGFGMCRCLTLLDPERQVDFLEEALVFASAATAYAAALILHTNGFIAVFTAGLALSHGGRLRRAPRNHPLMPRVLRIAARLEKAAWLTILVVLGALLTSAELRLRMLLFAAALFLLIRPLAVRLGMGGIALPFQQWKSVAWCAPRGVASLYCLVLSIDQGLDGPFARQLAGITLVVVVSSLIASGILSLPLGRASPGTVDL